MNKGIPTKNIWAVRLLMLTVALSLQGICARADSMTEEQAKTKALSFLQKRHPEATGRRLAAARMDKELASVSIEGACPLRIQRGQPERLHYRCGRRPSPQHPRLYG